MKYDYPKAILKLRVKLNISQEELGQLLGVSFTSINRWENGHYEPTKLVKQKLYDLFVDNNIELEDGKENVKP